MIALTSGYYMTPEEYLEFEEQSDIRHEYIDGEIYAMAGTSGLHNIISGNLYLLLRNGLKNSGCRTYLADMKVKLFERSRFFYPDVLVTCNSQDDPKLSYVNFPKVIIEVLSESTEKFDRGDKFLFYQSIPSLQEYILVSSDRHCVQCYRRWENELWLLQTYQGETAIAAIECFGISAPLSEIYATIDFSMTDKTNLAP